MNEPNARTKQSAAHAAAAFAESGMVLGLGAGSTALFALQRIGEMLREGDLRDVRGVPCSEQVAGAATRWAIPLTTLERDPVIDLTIDGADEVDPNMSLIKGGGGAMVREKIVAQASVREVIVVDESKLSPALGTRRGVPVAVLAFGWTSQAQYLAELGAHVALRRIADGQPFVTDDGHWVLDCHFGPIDNVEELARRIEARAGIVQHGLFVNLATDVIVAGPDGVRHLTRR